MIRLRGIEKRFSSNGVKALSGVDFDLNGGEIHALLGENGAGKSTLMHVLAGYIKPGKGHIFIDNKEVRFASPARALAAGIGMVRQHSHLVPGFTVWENCALGSTVHSGPWVKRGALRRKTAELNERWDFGLPLDSSAESLSVSQGQKAAILGLLLRDVKYLIFDEPAAVLAPDETERLFEVFKKLKEEGRGLVLISHKLEETLKLAGRITVLRRGKTTASLDPQGLDGKKLRDLIFGESEFKEISPGPAVLNTAGKAAAERTVRSPETPTGRAPSEAGQTRAFLPALELKDFTVRVPGLPIIRGIDLRLERGKILGIAGVTDSGLETLELAAAGYIPSSGSMRINGMEMPERSTGAFRRAGGAYLGTRFENAAYAPFPISDLLIIHAHRRLQRRGFLKRGELEKYAGGIMKNARVPHPVKGLVMSLSGGQLQRILLMREYAENTPLLILAEPGRGLDIRYWNRFSLLLRERARAGTGILLFSTNAETLLSVSDEVLILRNGLFSDCVGSGINGPEVRERLRKAMVGGL
ncbi:MAG: ATP-binding cassette domain-containing protein [Treponema sp.]|jgi:simple sugar transport system ATP-binding protein|nr:ATP-binding cassette domain-containing protein [Treponema sp.]